MSNDWNRQLRALLPPAVWDTVAAIGRIAAAEQVRVYFVGGIVRDAMLERPSPDVDIVVAGDGAAFAERVQARLGGETVTHGRFGTANWRPAAEDNLEIDIDFVTARKETYAHPAALPDVIPSTIEDDLRRRDFTINAMAMRLDAGHVGELLDPFHGRADLDTGVVRVLHGRSFIDDPTRMWRAVRFEQRLGFTIEPQTLGLLLAARPYLSRLSADRVRHELMLILAEDDPVPALMRLHEVGVLTAVHPQLAWTDTKEQALARLAATADTPVGRAALTESRWAAVRLLVLLADAPPDVGDALHVSRRVVQNVGGVLRLRKAAADWRPETRPSVVDEAVRNERPEVLWAVSAVLPPGHAAVDLLNRYTADWRHITPTADGHTLRQMGMTPGPQMGLLLADLRRAWLNGRIHTPAEEEAFLREQIAALENG